MRVTIFGSGYVGLVTGACLADAGNDVLCVDVDEKKIAALTPDQINAAMRRYIDPAKITIVKAGDFAKAATPAATTK